MKKGFYIILEKADVIGFFLGVAYSKQEKDFQINLLLCNLNFAIGYKFKQKGVK